MTTAVDPAVTACLAVHATAPVAHCACCGICEGCDATLGVQETPDHELCETCATAADGKRLEQLLCWPYGANPAA